MPRIIRQSYEPVGSRQSRESANRFNSNNPFNPVNEYNPKNPLNPTNEYNPSTPQLDGNDAPVMAAGKPTGQSMAIKRVDSHHTYTVLKLQGKETGISKSELSSDGKVLKVENAPVGATSDETEHVHYWDKQ